MTSASKAKGSAFERTILTYLWDQGWDAERLRLTGTEDEGDLVVRGGPTERLIIEAKAENRVDLSGYLREAERERLNYAKHRSLEPSTVRGLVVVKRRMAPVGQAYAITTLEQYFGMAQ